MLTARLTVGKRWQPDVRREVSIFYENSLTFGSLGCQKFNNVEFNFVERQILPYACQ